MFGVERLQHDCYGACMDAMWPALHDSPCSLGTLWHLQVDSTSTVKFCFGIVKAKSVFMINFELLRSHPLLGIFCMFSGSFCHQKVLQRCQRPRLVEKQSAAEDVLLFAAECHGQIATPTVTGILALEPAPSC